MSLTPASQHPNPELHTINLQAFPTTKLESLLTSPYFNGSTLYTNPLFSAKGSLKVPKSLDLGRLQE